MEHLIRHFNPSIFKNKNGVFLSKVCLFTNYVSKRNNIFRYNPKLKVAKCYHCGRSFKNINKMIHQIKSISEESKIVKYDNPKLQYKLPF